MSDKQEQFTADTQQTGWSKSSKEANLTNNRTDENAIDSDVLLKGLNPYNKVIDSRQKKTRRQEALKYSYLNRIKSETFPKTLQILVPA